MKLDTSIPLWGILLFLIPFLITGIASLIKMWRDLQQHSREIHNLSEDQQDLRDLIEDRNEKTLAEIKKLEVAFALQKESLVEIKTLLKLIIDNRIRHDQKP